MHFHHQLRAFIRPSSRLGIRAATISLRPPPMLILQLLMAAPRLSTSSDRLAYWYGSLTRIHVLTLCLVNRAPMKIRGLLYMVLAIPFLLRSFS